MDYTDLLQDFYRQSKLLLNAQDQLDESINLLGQGEIMLNAANDALKQKEQLIYQMQTDIHDLIKQRDDLAQWKTQKESTNVAKSNRELRAKIKQLEGQKKAAGGTDELNKQIHMLKAKAANQLRDLNAKDERLKQLDEVILAINKAKDEAEATLKLHSLTIKDNDNRLQIADKELSDLRSTADNQAEQLNTLKKILSEKDHYIKELIRDLKGKDKDIKSLRNKNKALKEITNNMSDE